MVNAFQDTAAWSSYVQTTYDRAVAWVLRSLPQFRQTIDKHPVDPAMQYNVVTLSIQPDFTSLATTPLTENVVPDSINLGNPTQVSVTLNEYGAWAQMSLKLANVAFPQGPPVDMLLARGLAYHQLDTLDANVRGVFDSSTNVAARQGGNLVTAGAVPGSVTATDKFGRDLAVLVKTRLQTANVRPKSGEDFLCIAHPDVILDLQAETTLTSWAAPHTYGTDTENIYSGETGRFMGVRYIQSPRCTTATDGSTSAKVYRSYMFGAEALVEANKIEPHTVLGNITDPLFRERPIGWYGLLGWSIYRPTALKKIYTSSSVGTLA